MTEKSDVDVRLNASSTEHGNGLISQKLEHECGIDEWMVAEVGGGHHCKREIQGHRIERRLATENGDDCELDRQPGDNAARRNDDHLDDNLLCL